MSKITSRHSASPAWKALASPAGLAATIGLVLLGLVGGAWGIVDGAA